MKVKSATWKMVVGFEANAVRDEVWQWQISLILTPEKVVAADPKFCSFLCLLSLLVYKCCKKSEQASPVENLI